MRTIPFSRIAILAVATGLGAILLAPVAGYAETPEYAPVPADASATRHVMGSGGLGSSPNETIIVMAPVAPPSWDETSGYGAVETTRAMLALPTVAPAITNQAANDVRWAPSVAAEVPAARHVMGSGGLGSPQGEAAIALAPVAAPSWDEMSGYGTVEMSRAMRAPSWDVTSGYGSVEASRAALAERVIP